MVWTFITLLWSVFAVSVAYDLGKHIQKKKFYSVHGWNCPVRFCDFQMTDSNYLIVVDTVTFHYKTIHPFVPIPAVPIFQGES